MKGIAFMISFLASLFWVFKTSTDFFSVLFERPKGAGEREIFVSFFFKKCFILLAGAAAH